MLVIVKYPPSKEISRRKLSLVLESDTVVLLQDAVLYALGDPLINDLKNKGVKIYALKEDFQARGYSEDQSVVDLVDYSRFVDLIVDIGEKVMG